MTVENENRAHCYVSERQSLYARLTRTWDYYGNRHRLDKVAIQEDDIAGKLRVFTIGGPLRLAQR